MENINYGAVIIAAIAQFVIGAVWYSPALFANKWLAALGKTPGVMEMGNKQYIAFAKSFIGSLCMAFVFAHIITSFGEHSVTAGIGGGIWMWIGFGFPILLNGYLYDGALRTGENRTRLFFINAGYYLVSLIVMGSILAMWY